MEKLQKWGRQALRWSGPAGTWIGAVVSVVGAVMMVAEANEVLGLSGLQVLGVGLAVLAVAGAVVLHRHEHILGRINEHLGNEHKRALARDGIQPTIDKYLDYIRHGDMGTIRRFWEAGIVNQKSASGQSDLMAACSRGRAVLVDELIRRGCDPREAQRGGKTPLIVASQMGKTSTVRNLLKYECSLEHRTTDGGFSALFVAVANAKPVIVRELLEHGANVDRVDEDNRTPLMAALIRGNWDSAQALLDAGADVNARDRYGAQPLDYALGSRHRDRGDIPQEILEELEERGAERAKPPVQLVGGAAGFSSPAHIRAEWERAPTQSASDS